ncbi:ABC transporter permease, partial [Pseudomonas stutzeri]|nr:ABC transporter permease [Stutzerimonas stutzeri]
MFESKTPTMRSTRARRSFLPSLSSTGKTSLVALIFVCALGLVATFAPIIAPYDPYKPDLANVMMPPVWFDAGTWSHPLGTDSLGRDYLS